MYESLKEEYKYFLDNKEKLIKKYKGKYIVLKNKEVISVYDEELEAIKETLKEHEIGTFLVLKCEQGDNNCTQMYNSRVAFT